MNYEQEVHEEIGVIPRNAKKKPSEDWKRVVEANKVLPIAWRRFRRTS